MTRSKIIISVLLAASVAAVLPPPLAEAMTLSPPMFDFTVNPGDVIKDVIRIYNEDPFPLVLSPREFNFTAKQGDETEGAPEFYPEDEVRNGHELAPWLTVDAPTTFTLQPSERYNIPITIVVPPDAAPGGYFGAVNFGTVGGEKEGEGPQIGVIASTTTLFFLRVNGDVKESLDIAEFRADKPKYASLPVDFSVRVQNGGNVHLRPTGNIFIKDMFGRQVASLPVNPDFRTVLPGSARRFDASWFRRRLPSGTSEYAAQWRNFAIGKYQAQLVLSFGGRNSFQTATVEFWVFPWMVLLTLAGVLVLAWLLVRFGLRGYEQRVIRRYEERMKKANKNN